MMIIRNKPTAELRSLVKSLGGTWSGDIAICRCPAHADRTPSLSIRQGDRSILVTCHAGCESRDVLRELARIARIPDFKRTVIEKATPNHGRPHLAIWRASKPIENTLAERYVRETRNICAPLNDLRYHPRCPKGQGAFVTFEPALIVAMRRAREIAAIQRIFLDPGTATSTEKLCLGQAIGAAWTNGPPARTIGLCEGFETAAAYMSLTGIQAWATMGAKRFHQLTIPSGVETLILLADNDTEGRRARDRAWEAYKRPGLTIDTEWPPGGMNDWAQLLKR
ncbi:DUF7146 domain-containing protein [Sphingobium xenophagum]